MSGQIDEGILDLVRAARQGNVQAYGELYEKTAPVVFRFLYAHLDERMDAEDLTGEVFLRVWQSLPRYRETGVPFSVFLLKVARNALIDHYRRSPQRKIHQALDEERMAERALHLDDPEKQSDFNELRTVLNELQPDQQTVLVLRFLVGLSPQETGQVLGKSNGAVRVTQHRALAALREILNRK